MGVKINLQHLQGVLCQGCVREENLHLHQPQFPQKRSQINFLPFEAFFAKENSMFAPNLL